MRCVCIPIVFVDNLTNAVGGCFDVYPANCDAGIKPEQLERLRYDSSSFCIDSPHKAQTNRRDVSTNRVVCVCAQSGCDDSHRDMLHIECGPNCRTQINHAHSYRQRYRLPVFLLCLESALSSAHLRVVLGVSSNATTHCMRLMHDTSRPLLALIVTAI